MPLLFPDTEVGREAMLTLYRDFVAELSSEHQILGAPPVPVTDPIRIETAKDLLLDTLTSVRGMDPERLDREQLRQWVNLQYDVSRVAQEYLKTCLAMPAVPSKRA